jgi:L-ribulose-5-phosphate 3-epimerase
MQGRLLPPQYGHFQCFPRNNWEQEFSNAQAAGLECIEWIYDVHGEDVNPIATAAGIQKMLELIEKYSVQVLSVCADYFMVKTFVRVSLDDRQKHLEMLLWLLGRCPLLGINRVVLPCVDNSRIETEEDRVIVTGILRQALPVAEANRVEIHLETSLEPRPFAAFLEQLPHPMLMANYDSGNSSSLGYQPADEFAAYGNRVGSVHIKDRVKGGGTVPLGKGDANFRELFECLRKVNYDRDYILQVAREMPGNEVTWLGNNRKILLEMLDGKFPK